jgi:hypothetical protein
MPTLREAHLRHATYYQAFFATPMIFISRVARRSDEGWIS